uniref:Queuosine 5'-phosphate N-glycosylase/hydrolase n=1 Tax=Corethron hystrix TaxID=216773 RepID=A0A7S1C0Q1_9STRA|mmetsp:Transcript_7832/g.17002  ORF Transcript_7832/g.17002 Transcript_7832/m.17002 type:complete len:500 (+) Transcript_7832:115-1614(+)
MTNTTTTVSTATFQSISPCDNVRRSCLDAIKYRPDKRRVRKTTATATTASTVGPDDYGSCADAKSQHPQVDIDDGALQSLAFFIASMVAEKEKLSSSTEYDSSDDGKKAVDMVEWDECGWHYTGEEIEDLEERMERVALYVLALDCINFCFWPDLEEEEIDTAEKGLVDRDEHSSDSSNEKKEEELQYHHMASALASIMARVDANGCPVVTAKSLANIDATTLRSWLSPLLPSVAVWSERRGCTVLVPRLPGLAERARLLSELGNCLLASNGGSALHLLREAKGTADGLVRILTDTFPGFRDTCVDPRTGRQMFLYKRAQIAVADLWAAFRSIYRDHPCHFSSKHDNTAVVIDNPCDFRDIRRLTTFADYRVPQLLREKGVILYDNFLAETIDGKIELPAGSIWEVLIRAATVVVVDRLVDAIREIILRGGDGKSVDTSSSIKEGAVLALSSLPLERRTRIAHNEIDAVRVDWYLWQVGEKLEGEGKLRPHHRTRTVFY